MDLVLGEIDLATVKLHTLSVRGRCCWTGWYTSATGYSSLRSAMHIGHRRDLNGHTARALPMLATAMLRDSELGYAGARLATTCWT